MEKLYAPDLLIRGHKNLFERTDTLFSQNISLLLPVIHVFFSTWLKLGWVKNIVGKRKMLQCFPSVFMSFLSGSFKTLDTLVKGEINPLLHRYSF